MTARIALVPGDPCGIGPELTAKLLAQEGVCERAAVTLVSDPWIWDRGQAIAGVAVESRPGDEPAREPGPPTLLALESVAPGEVEEGTEPQAAGGRAALAALDRALALAREGVVDAIVFGPLNKQALHLAGYGFPDELHWFAHELGHAGPCGELNVLEELWTGRVTSHVALAEVAGLINEDAIVEAVALLDGALRRAGFAAPRIAVAGLNPHAGDGGIFGREEIDVIAPAVARAKGQGIDASGPFPADTVFLRARAGDYDAVATMYHDQGQIAMKLMGFDRGVTVQGGLPVAITTPAHGSAFDIAGQGRANVGAMVQAYEIGRRMGESRRDNP